MNKLILSIILTLVLIGYIILDLLINDSLWDASTSFALSMQKEIPKAEQILYEFFTYIVFIPPLTAVYCFLFANNKLNALLYLGVTIISVTANEILKNIYHQARPYMIESEIQSLKCNADYGKPSGHSQNSVVMICLMPFLLFPELRRLRKNQIYVEMPENPKQHTGYTIASISVIDQKNNKISVDVQEQSQAQIALKIGVMIFFLASIVLTGMSRVFLGVHSLGQVFLGWIYGAYIAAIYIFVIHRNLKQYILKLLDPVKNQLAEQRHLIPISLLALIMLQGLCLGLLKVNALVYFDEFSMGSWIDRINDCRGTEYTKTSPQILYNSCFSTAAVCAVITGLLVGGVLIQGSYQEGLFKNNKNQLDAKSLMYRVLLLIVPCVILIPLLFINSKNVVIQTITQILPLSFGGGFIINCIYPYLLRKFNLQVPGDFLYFNEQKYLLQKMNMNSFDISVRSNENSYQNTF